MKMFTLVHYSQLHSIVENVSPYDISIVLTDADVVIASPFHNVLEQPCVTGNTYINHVTNGNGECLLLLCHSTRLCC